MQILGGFNVSDLLSRIEFPGIAGCLEIVVLAALFYFVLYFFQGTRGTPVLTGLVLLFIILIGITRFFHLDTLNWLLGRVSVYLAVAFLIIFHPEIRRALAELGKQHVFGPVHQRTVVDHVMQAAGLLAKRKIGALIAIEQAIGTKAIQDTGIKIDSMVTPELLASIFFPYTPLHDGGVVISGNRIMAAACVFPLTQRDEFSKTLGTRHRAAVGLTEETDALVIVVSEETGAISVCHKGRLIQNMEEEDLRSYLTSALVKPDKKAKTAFSRVKEQLDLTPQGVARTEGLVEDRPPGNPP